MFTHIKFVSLSWYICSSILNCPLNGTLTRCLRRVAPHLMGAKVKHAPCHCLCNVELTAPGFFLIIRGMLGSLWHICIYIYIWCRYDVDMIYTYIYIYIYIHYMCFSRIMSMDLGPWVYPSMVNFAELDQRKMQESGMPCGMQKHGFR